jgi:hypothetical protein
MRRPTWLTYRLRRVARAGGVRRAQRAPRPGKCVSLSQKWLLFRAL